MRNNILQGVQFFFVYTFIAMILVFLPLEIVKVLYYAITDTLKTYDPLHLIVYSNVFVFSFIGILKN